MIIDIDSKDSVLTILKAITEKHFDIGEIYSELKSNSITSSLDFWKITDYCIDQISDYLNLTSIHFEEIMKKELVKHDAKLMGYHCTRHSDKNCFLKNGILPLSEKTVELSENQNSSRASDLKRIRTKQGPGPYFFLSYLDTKSPNNIYCQNGPEILIACNGNQPGNIVSEAIPLIIHCAIPFSILPDFKYYLFCILVAYFNFLDPEDETENIFSGWAIDLKNKALPPQYIVNVEEV